MRGGESPTTSVFVSSTVDAMKSHRSELIRAVQRLGYHARNMENFGARPGNPWAECRDEIAKCDVFLGFYGREYGSIPTTENPEGRSFVELEFEEATRIGRRRLCYIERSAEDSDSPELRTFLARVKQEIVAFRFSSSTDLVAQVRSPLQ